VVLQLVLDAAHRLAEGFVNFTDWVSLQTQCTLLEFGRIECTASLERSPLLKCVSYGRQRGPSHLLLESWLYHQVC
jgi:hypothetical protein